MPATNPTILGSVVLSGSAVRFVVPLQAAVRVAVLVGVFLAAAPAHAQPDDALPDDASPQRASAAANAAPARAKPHTYPASTGSCCGPSA